MSYAHTRIIDRFQEEAEYNNTICGIHGKQIKNIIERSLRDCIDYEGTHPYQDKKEFAYSVELIRKTN